jgi:ankyrin repeat protein
MNGYPFLLLSLLFRLIAGSPHNRYRIAPIRNLKIDEFKLKSGQVKPRSVIYLNREAKRVSFAGFLNREILFDLYEMAETGVIDFTKDVGLLYLEIFEKNGIYAFTPAERAVYNGETAVLETFFDETEVVSYDPVSIASIFRNLFALAIQRNQLEALQCILKCTSMEVKDQAFLSIAAQHRSSDKIMNFLLNDCDLKSEIDQTNNLNTYLTPLNASIKFNNFDAVILFLKHGASLTISDAKNETPLGTIFKLNKHRMFAHIFKNFPEYCEVIDQDGNSLYHHVAIYSTNTSMISMVRELCPNLSVNIKNSSGFTPINICFMKLNLNKEIVLAFTSIGADIFHVPKQTWPCPLQAIMEYGHEDCFYSILELYRYKAGSMSRIVQYICEKGAWEWLDRVIEIYPDIPTAWFDFSKVTLAALLHLNAWRAFRLFLRISRSPIPHGTILNIAENGSGQFLKVAVENGANIDEISERDRERILENGNEEMFNLIEDLVTTKRLNSVKEFTIE